MGCHKGSSKREVIAIQSYLKKQEKSQINNLTLQLKQLEKEEQKTPKFTKGKKSYDQIRNKLKINDGNNRKDQ